MVSFLPLRHLRLDRHLSCNVQYHSCWEMIQRPLSSAKC